MRTKFRRRDVLGAGASTFFLALAGCNDTSEPPADTDGSPDNTTGSDTNETDDSDTNEMDETDDSETTESTSAPMTILNGDVEQHGELALSSPEFNDGEQLPDSAGYTNDNANPELEISGVPEETESLVLVVDDPDAQSVAGHTWNHWAVWDIDPDIESIPQNWDGAGATEGFNDFMEYGYGGPSPPEGTHDYRFKLVAIDSELGVPAETRKTRVGSTIEMNAEVLGATQIVGTYSADQ